MICICKLSNSIDLLHHLLGFVLCSQWNLASIYEKCRNTSDFSLYYGILCSLLNYTMINMAIAIAYDGKSTIFPL